MPINFIFLFLITSSFAAPVALTDNILFAFEKCRTLDVDLEKGQLKETKFSSFDLHCRKVKPLEFKCSFFDAGSDKKLKDETFTGGSELGSAELKSGNGSRLNFLIGKRFAAFYSGTEPMACAGIHLFESEALKQKK